MTTSSGASSTVGTTAPPPTTAPMNAAIVRRRVDAYQKWVDAYQKWRDLPFRVLDLIWTGLPGSEVMKLAYVSKRYAQLATSSIAKRFGFNLPYPVTPWSRQSMSANIQDIINRLTYVSNMYRQTVARGDEFFSRTTFPEDPPPPLRECNIARTVRFLEQYRFFLKDPLDGIQPDWTILNCFLVTTPFSGEAEREVLWFIHNKYTINAATIYIAFVRGNESMLEELLRCAPAAILKSSLSNIFSFLAALLIDKTQLTDGTDGGDWEEKMGKILSCLKREAPFPSDLLLTISRGDGKTKPDFDSVVDIFDYCVKRELPLTTDIVLNFHRHFVLEDADWEKIRQVCTAQGRVIPSSFILEMYEQYQKTRADGLIEDLYTLLQKLPFEMSDECLTAAPAGILPFEMIDILIEARHKPLDVLLVNFCLVQQRLIKKAWGTLSGLAFPEDAATVAQLREEFVVYRIVGDDLDPNIHITLAELGAWMGIAVPSA